MLQAHPRSGNGTGLYTGSTVGASSNTATGFEYIADQYDTFVLTPNQNTHIFTHRHNYGHQIISNQQEVYTPAWQHASTGTPVPTVNIQYIHNRDTWSGPGLDTTTLNGASVMARPSASNVVQTKVLASTSGTTAERYVRPMWKPFQKHNKPGSEQASEMPPKWIGFGLAPIIAVTATNDNIQYQEGQVFW